MIVLQFTRLERPSDGLDNSAWDLIWKCSMPKPDDRPTFIAVEPELRLLAESWKQISADPKATRQSSIDFCSIDLDQLTMVEVRF
jgi:hypothetical protein